MSGFKSSDALSAPAAPTAPEPAAPHQPLGLTVHDLPRPDEAVAALQRSSGRRQMLLLLLICLAPVLASYFTYYVVRPGARASFGTLIEPQRPMPEQLALRAPDGSEHRLGELRGQWLIVSVAPGACDAACQNNLYLQRQLRESLGREKDRVDWVWLVSDAVEPPAGIAHGLEQATVLHADAQALAQWLAPAPGHALSEHLYVIDPMGHWMMRFPAALDRTGASKARRDLERLLRASSAWDKPGREAQP
jgi:hypothetical protein